MHSRARRVLAVDLRPRSFGFVVFEGPDQLLDWGVKVFRDLSGSEIPASTKIAPLIHEFAPAVVLLKSSVWEKKSTKAQLDSLLDAIHVESRDRTAVRLISPQRIRRMFPDRLRNKDDLASRVAARFPDLAWKLPPPRKYPRREHYRMSIFDANPYLDDRPGILEPSFYKYEDETYVQLQPQWEVFFERLLSADCVIVVGYSLPDADSLARSKIMTSFQVNANCRWLVIDPSESVLNRYRRLLGNQRLRISQMSLAGFNNAIR